MLQPHSYMHTHSYSHTYTVHTYIHSVHIYIYKESQTALTFRIFLIYLNLINILKIGGGRRKDKACKSLAQTIVEGSVQDMSYAIKTTRPVCQLFSRIFIFEPRYHLQ